jgi:hypothetical protein
MKIGSDAHQERFCRDFIASHCHFDPATLTWPDLNEVALERGRQANDERDFSATQASVFLEGFSLPSFIEECCVEH